MLDLVLIAIVSVNITRIKEDRLAFRAIAGLINHHLAHFLLTRRAG